LEQDRPWVMPTRGGEPTISNALGSSTKLSGAAQCSVFKAEQNGGCGAASTSSHAEDEETVGVGLSSSDTETEKSWATSSDKSEGRHQRGGQSDSFQHQVSCAGSSKAEPCLFGVRPALRHTITVAGRAAPLLSTPPAPIPGTPVSTAQICQTQWAEQPSCCLDFPKTAKSLKQNLAASPLALVAGQASPLRQIAMSLRRTVPSTSSPSVILARDSHRNPLPAGPTLPVPQGVQVRPAYEGTGAAQQGVVLARDPQGSPLAPGQVMRPVLARDPCGKPLAHDSMQCSPLPQNPSLLQCRRQTEESLYGHQVSPVKIWLPEQLMTPVKACDPSLPVKKLPVYLEFAASASESLRKLDRTLPVKLQVPSFLLQDPARFRSIVAR